MVKSRASVLSSGSRHQRQTARRTLGPLSHLIIAPNTSKRYRNALLSFFLWIARMSLEVPCCMIEIDMLVSQFVDTCWQEGEPRSLIGDLLSGFSHFVPSSKRQLNGSWRLHAAWGRHELPERALAISSTVMLSLASVAWKWGFTDVALLLRVGFHCFLRTGELCTLRAAQCVFSIDRKQAVIMLPETKGTARKGAIESVSITDPELSLLLWKVCKDLKPGEALLRRTPQQFRAIFKAAVELLGLDSLVKPYSLRRGGATHWFRETGSLDSTVDRGRWGSVKTARIYITTALAETTELSVALQAKLKQYAAWILKQMSVTNSKHF
jgi:hypothetical protein